MSDQQEQNEAAGGQSELTAGLEREIEFTTDMVEAIYAAWHGAGVDIAGGNWKRFVEMLPVRSNEPS